MSASARQLYIRADGNSAIGYGHLRRTLTVLAALNRRRPVDAVYLMRPDSDAEPARAAGATVERIAGGDWDALRSRVQADPAPLLIDTFSLTAGALDGLHAAGLRLAAFDDGCRLERYAVDVLIDVAPLAEQAPYRTLAKTRRLLGCAYFPMRAEFVVDGSAAWREEVRRIAVTFGGSDPDDMTARVLEALAAGDCPWPTTAILGPGYRGRAEAIADACDSVETVRDVQDMARVLRGADLAISAASGVAFEVACLGLPAVHITIAPDQRRIAAAFADAGAALNAGWHEEFEPQRLWSAVSDVACDADRRRAIRSAAMRLIDGRGAARVAEGLETLWATGDGPPPLEGAGRPPRAD